MFRKLIIILSILSATASMSAELISPEQALSRIHGNRSDINKTKPNKRSKYILKSTYKSKTEPTVYVFDFQDADGFIILSADDSTPAILGYSDRGIFDPTGIPPQLQWLMDEYSRQIDFIRKNNIPVNQTTHGDLEAIEPLIKTFWDQGTPYNNLCPDHNGKTSYTGCVATAMAQVMRYWSYPEIGVGSHEYTASTIKKDLQINFAERNFDWANMSEMYIEGQYSPEEADAVAWLMKACGHAVDMNYSSVSSGTLSILVVGALRDFFKYDDGVRFADRIAYSANEWETMLHDNIKNIGPVVYNGYTQLSGGHSFVCDGYDGEGRFHINWGWGGLSDGYFMLDVLDPASQGIGGATAGFNFKQNAILGIRPPDNETATKEEPRLTQYGSLTAIVTKGRTINFGLTNYSPLAWGSNNPDLVRLKLGAKLEPQGETPGETQYLTTSVGTVILTPGTYYSYGENFTPSAKLASDLPLGTYKMSLVTQDNLSSSGVWSPMIVPYGYTDYITVVKDENGITTISPKDPTLTISEAKVISEVVYNKPITVSATITNSSDVELTQGVSIVLLNPTSGFRRFVGEGVNVTLKPGETIVKDITSDLYIMAGSYDPANDINFTLALHNPVTTTYYGTYGNIVMSEKSGINDICANAATFLISVNHNRITVSSLTQGSLVEIYTPTGLLINSAKADNSSIVLFEIASGQNGVYIIKVSDPSGKYTAKKIII